jgi:predicted MPP superfamily phosphohydrolase
MRLAWLTDIHLNFVKLEDRRRFYSTIRDAQPDAILLGGDIAEAPTLVEHLHDLDRALDKPIYFVLGNHDFYRSSLADVHARIRDIRAPNLIWLTDSGIQLIGGETALVGDDGWADGRIGNYLHSRIFLNDYLLIHEFANLSTPARLRLLNQLGDASAGRLGPKLREACAQRKRIILLTHVPPFREACWHEGQTSDEEWLPHFTCKAMGDVILEVMDQHPECELLVLCGHTHGGGIAQMRPNVVVKTGGAEYGRPAIQEILEA